MQAWVVALADFRWRELFLAGRYQLKSREIGSVALRIPGHQSIAGDRGVCPDEEIRER